MKREPVAVGAAVAAVANYVVFQVVGEQLSLEVLAAVAVVVNSVIGLVVRSKVSPA